MSRPLGRGLQGAVDTRCINMALCLLYMAPSKCTSRTRWSCFEDNDFDWEVSSAFNGVRLKPNRWPRAGSRTPAMPHIDFSMAQSSIAPVVGDVAEGLEAPVQVLYLSILLALLSAAAFAVVRQVLVQREMDERSKVLGELIRTGDAVSEDYFELGVVLARKRLYTQALKNYLKAIKLWQGDTTELAQVPRTFSSLLQHSGAPPCPQADDGSVQVHNAMGFCYGNMDKQGDAIREYTKATELQPGYVTAWNNLGDVLEKEGRWKEALPVYESAFELDPDNETSKMAVERLRTRAARVSV